MEHRPFQEKMEHPRRVAGMRPAQTLRWFGLEPGMSVLDVGAGTGLFAREAARITQAAVHALEIDPARCRILRETTRADNVLVHCADAASPGLADESIDLALLVTVLHEFDDPNRVLRALRRVVRPGGIVGVVDFLAARTPMGPRRDHRVSWRRACRLLRRAGFEPRSIEALGQDFYRIRALRNR